MSYSEQPLGRPITDIASRYGLTHRALRYYEQRGILTPIRIGTVRLYTENDERRVQTIYTTRKMGFTVTEIESVMRRSKQPIDIADFLRLLGREGVERQLNFLKQQQATTLRGITELEQFLAGLLSE